MDQAAEQDVNRIIRLADALQRRIGIFPKVEIHAFTLYLQPGEVTRMLMVKPRSLPEISRTIRAAQSLSLSVRACGERTGGFINLYGSESTVLIDCSDLADQPRMKKVEIHKPNPGGPRIMIVGIAVLAGVGIRELVDYQIRNGFEVAQSAECITDFGTVVGAIVAGCPGIIGPAGKTIGACLADEVISVTMVDSKGDEVIIEDKDEFRKCLTTMGALGIVYRVVLNCRLLSMTKVRTIAVGIVDLTAGHIYDCQSYLFGR